MLTHFNYSSSFFTPSHLPSPHLSLHLSCLCCFLSPCLPLSLPLLVSPARLVIPSTASQWANRWLAGWLAAVVRPRCASTHSPLSFCVSPRSSLSFSLFNPTVGFCGTTDSTPGQVLCFLFKHSSNRALCNTCTHTHTF